MKYCIANWKMNLTSRDGLVYLDKIGQKINEHNESFEKASMIICPPYTALDLMSTILIEAEEGLLEDLGMAHVSDVQLGAQNMNPNNEGAYTGEISSNMLNQYRVKWVIVGHSERRSMFAETDEFINLKIKTALNHNINPILCIGETLEERELGNTKEILFEQLEKGLKDIICSKDFLIAYEPVWAIGTGQTADDDMIESANNMILSIVKELKYDIKNPKILYGGSVNNNNAENLSKICNLDGFLIGGASLDAEQFYSIYNVLKGE